MNLDIDRIDRYVIDVPFRDVPERNLRKEQPEWTYFEVFEVELGCGAIGHGETMLYYTWGETTDEDVDRARGRDAASLMWDDSLGAGLQMALFDAVGRAMGVPVHNLLGDQVHDRTPLSWWCIDMPPADWVSECQRALDEGYTSVKLKGRPWFDIFEQLDALTAEFGDELSYDVDFNGTLIDADRGIPFLTDLLDAYPQISHIEGPIPQDDVEGNVRITEAIDAPTALHYGVPDPTTVVSADVCDGFVSAGGASELREQAGVAAATDRSLWLQLVGTDLTAAFSLHVGAVLTPAEWPAINCHQIYDEPLLTDDISVSDGYANVPDGPGLGYEVDMDVVERLAVDRPATPPNPPRLIECSWPDGPTIYIAGDADQTMFEYATESEAMPYFERGAKTQIVPDDGSDWWQQTHADAQASPIVVRE